MKKITIGITDYFTPPAELEKSAFPGAEFVFLDSLDNKDALSLPDGLLVYKSRIGRDTIQLLKNCKMIVRYGVGYEKVDLEACTAHGIAVCNNPDYGTEEVADSACAMILSLARRTFSYDHHCRDFQSGWQENTETPLPRLSRCTLGIIGCGRIGTAVALRMKAFGMNITFYDPYKPSGYEKSIGISRTDSLEGLLSQSDIVTLHCPQNTETAGMIDSGFIGSMKQDAILVNTARGGIFADLDAVMDGLKSGKLRAAAADVLPQEPPDMKHPLLDAWRRREEWLAGRLVITPHVAYFSEHSIREMRFKAAETLRLFFENGIIRNRVND
ncbi:MAG: hypothetical protein A2Y33_02325 [Spirochaetes bacterium GWF1_51_8]|nr:MAG: hypothetical protein A2Y33_02325 [Spirochaetes bacterium GWF1_51_8]